MKKFLILLVFLSGAIALVGSIASACGDKFLIVGRCVSYRRLHRAAHPGTLLLVWSANSGEGVAVRDADLARTLAQGGHDVVVLEDPNELDRAVASGRFHLVLVDTARPFRSRGCREHPAHPRRP